MAMPSRLPPFEQRQLFNAVRDGSHRFDSVEDVLQTFLVPLQPLLGNEVANAFFDAPLAFSSTSANPLPTVSVIEATQEALLVKISIDWQDALVQHGVFDKLLEACFFASPTTMARARGLLQQCGLRVISRVLSSGRKHSSSTEASGTALHPLVCSAILLVCNRAASLLSMDSLVQSVQAEPNQARKRISWSETLRLLTSFPDRVANFMLGKVPDALGREEWNARVIVRGLAHALKKPTEAAQQHGRAQLLAEVVSHLGKSGYLATIPAPSTDAQLAFWPVFLLNAVTDDAQESVAQQWLSLSIELNEETRNRVCRSLIMTLDDVARRSVGTSIVSAAERARPGSEGSIFLSPTAHTFIAAAWTVFDKFLVQDSDDENEPPAFLALALSSIPQVPIMAWVWGFLLTHTQTKQVVPLLDQTLQHWADQTRLKRSTLDQEQYLTTFITCLLASTPPSSGEEGKRTLMHVSRSPALLEGVSRHLEHPDPTIRRLGMLIAELISAKTTAEGAKGLQFGRGLWDGMGQGREEARVLRALHDGWNYHFKSVNELRRQMDDETLLTTLKIGLEQPSDSQLAVVQKPRQAKEFSGQPKSRTLPARVPPPPRALAPRSLITVLGSDDNDAVAELEAASESKPPLLKMFVSSEGQRHNVSQPLLDHEEVSSADEGGGRSSDSSSENDEQDDEQNKMHKLAADLAGLDPSEASKLSGLASRSAQPKKSTAKPSAPASDFEADREVHAPTFGDKRARPPVYISQLAPLLKSNERAKVKLGLKYAAVLIRRKSSVASGGRGEVDENAVDLGLSLVALHNNFSIEKFDERRLEALVALLIGSPKVTTAVLTEQVFGSQYSVAQRFGMLTAIAQGAIELATGDTLPGQHSQILDGNAKALGDAAATKAKHQGEEKIPAIRRERNLVVNINMRRTGPLIQQIPTQHAMSLPATLSSFPRQTWVETVGPSLIFPLINRFLAYYADFRTTQKQTRGRSAGAGMSALFGPQTIAALLDTLTILVDLAATTPSFPYEVTSLTLELVSALLLDGEYTTMGAATDSDAIPILASALNLFLVTVRHNLYSANGSRSANSTAAFVQQHGERLRPLLLVTRRTFEQSESGQGQKNAGYEDRFRTRVTSRAAALLLLASEMEESHRTHISSLLGFQV